MRNPPPNAFKDAALKRSNKRVLAQRKKDIAYEAYRKMKQAFEEESTS